MFGCATIRHTVSAWTQHEGKASHIRAEGHPEETLRPPQGNPHSTLRRMEMDDSEVNTDKGVKLMHNVPDDTVPGSQIARAQLIIDKQQCVYDPKVKAFLVQGTSQAHAVKLFPKNSAGRELRL